MRRVPPRALTVAGSDSSAGAGLQADLQTFAALGIFGACAATAVTAQDTRGVIAVEPVAARLVATQIEATLADGGADAVKTGMLCNREIVLVVARQIAPAGANKLVVDPVIRSSSGAELLDREGVRALRERLLPAARVVTPNLAEAAVLAGIEVEDLASATEAARRILRLGCRAAIVTGGHLSGEPVDVLADRRGVRRLRGHRVPGEAHGTGCVFSAAIAAHLARGEGLEEAAIAAKRFVEARLRRAVVLGAGRRFLDLR
jgi:hydroxymethylpyrimidine/phosphomethylpyrimidine kinase